MMKSRGKIKRLLVEYDPSTDILFASVQPVPPALSDEVAEDFFVRFDERSNKPVGFECLDFLAHVDDARWLASLPNLGTFWFEDRPFERMGLVDLFRAIGRDIRGRSVPELREIFDRPWQATFEPAA